MEKNIIKMGFICKYCDGVLELLNTDSRQEWFSEIYNCNNCDKKFERKVTFKEQSNLVDTDEIKEIEGDE